MRRILLISPYFPPMSVVGAKRALNLVRHLPSVGYEPVVLAAHPDRERCDPDHAALVPADTVVAYRYGGRPLGQRLRTSSPTTAAAAARRPQAGAKASGWKAQEAGWLGWSPSFFTPLDRYLWVTPAAVRAGVELIRSHRLQAIVVNADPWSGLLAGSLLSRATGVPLICDLRDSWSLHASKMALRPPLTRSLVRRLEASFFGAASKVILNTESACEAYIEAYRGRLPAERFTFIRNAFDRSLYLPAEQPPDKQECFELMYFGSFRKLVRPDELLAAFARFVQQRKLGPQQARFVFYGAQVDRQTLDRYGVAEHCSFNGRIGLAETMRVLRRASALALVVSEHDALQVPSKLYDYLAAERPIFALVADAPANREVRHIIETTGTGVVAKQGDTEQAARCLSVLYDGRRFEPEREQVARYGVGEQVARMAQVLDECADRRA